MYKISLRSRIILALVVIATVTSTLFVIVVLLIKQQLEEVIFDDMVHDQLQIFINQLDDGTYSGTNLFNSWEFYFSENVSDLHPDIQALAIGSHHSIYVNEHYYQVEVGERNLNQVYLTYDITDWEKQEHELLTMLIYGIGIVLLAAIIMGWQASKAILAPVQALTNRLTAIQPNERNITIAEDYQGNEIGLIATAFDRYLARLDQFVDRERSFTAAASHELRTPLSVMMGAVDVLGANEQSAQSQRALARIKRACAEMLAFIEATLFLSREDANTITQAEPTNVQKIIESLIEDNCENLALQKTIVNTKIIANPKLSQPASILKITIGNIFRNAIEHTKNGTIFILLDANSVTITDTGSGIEKSDLPYVYDRSFSTKQNGTGLGLNLVKRVCDRFNWEILIQSEKGKGSSVKINF